MQSSKLKKIPLVMLVGVLFVTMSVEAASRKKVRALKKVLAEQSATEGLTNVADLHVVDCLLPGQVRRLGNTTYLGARRPTKATAADCRLRGGEYVDYDRADYKTALKVWMESAQTGDAEAQANVGEIFERGLGGEPNYAAALIWYEKAAKQGNTRAQFNLGTMHEQGHGVPKNLLMALNWYRRAWGLAEDNIMFTSAAARQQRELAARLSREVAQKDAQINALEQQVESLRKMLQGTSLDSSQAQIQIETLQTLVVSLRQQQHTQRLQLDGIPLEVREMVVASAASQTLSSVFREPEQEQGSRLRRPDADQRDYKDLKLGSYYALLIGNAKYDRMAKLETPLNDIARAQRILENKYGFTVFTLSNGSNVAMMQAINDLSEILTEDDNLLLFYAGHGSRLSAGGVENGYWLPSNAEQPPRNTYWVPNEFVTGHLSRIKARRVLVVADSCYAGLLSGEPSMLLLGDNAPQYSNLDFLKFKLSKRSRMLLASGGDRPVLDDGGDGHSVFAGAFLDELENNTGLMASPELFLKIRDRVKQSAQTMGFTQQPELKTIKAAGHEIGDFFFLPRDL